jgi:hypothetical protein
MATHFDDSTRKVLDEFDACLREAEQVRNYIMEKWRQQSIYPQRRDRRRPRDNSFDPTQDE